MASRQSNSFSVPYDPRDWASGDLRANQTRRARQHQVEDGLASPPPPYSPQDLNQTRPESSNVNTAIAAEPVALNNAATSQMGHGSPNATQRRPPRHMNTIPALNRHSIHAGYPAPPPPPPPTSGTRQVSHSGIVSNTSIQNSYTSRDVSPGPAAFPPAARRAVSANAGFSTPEHSSGRSSSVTRVWHPGMPLPGPPPGPPPPSSSRSQSLSVNRDRSASAASASNSHQPRLGRHTMHATDLGPIPPTPSDWTEDHPLPSSSLHALHLDTNVNHLSKHPQAEGILSDTITQTPTSMLSRSSAIRDSSVKGLRERRAQSRNSRVIDASEIGYLSVQTDTQPVDSDYPVTNSGRSTVGPTSAGSTIPNRPKALSPLHHVVANNDATVESSANIATPPFSPRNQSGVHEPTLRSAGLPSKSLPTPPLSHPAPLSARSIITSSSEFVSTPVADAPDSFMRDAVHRHTEFLKKENSASTDSERLQVFADFIIHEAQIRQQRYRSTIESNSFDCQVVRDKLFQPLAHASTASRRGATLELDTQVTTNGNVPAPNRQDSHWRDYQPALSPIASMDYDEMSSRGRAPSRWWESQTGSQAGDRDNRIRRSKRESKYMGLSKEFLMAHSPGEEFPPSNSSMMFSGNNTYPKEKQNPETFGFYDDGVHSSPFTSSKAPESPQLLDISRFITLPPPYPRHYPAVNNNHPDLAEFRNLVRTLSDLEEVRTRKSRQKLSVEAIQSELQRKLVESRRIFRNSVQAQIADGSITYAEAAEAEEAHKQTEFELEKNSLQAEFDTLQDVVINPLHDMLNGRLAQLDTSIFKLQDELRSDARHQDPDRPQEEGDETPELLEKLTQLKWLFDTREQIYKECFELLSERNNSFRSIVLLPHKSSKNVEKIRETETFFQQDTQTRFLTHCEGSFKRHNDFLRIIDEHVRRGVELQSSAFWDIAPGLLDLLQKVPDDLRQLPSLHIPAKEYEENPSYHEHPQQYLYSLLSHAEKSTYQYIEGQVNLHCLLHEVKNGLLASRYRMMHAQEATAGTHYDGLADSRLDEEAALTAELKQKASMIEEQWLEALGSQLQVTRERVKTLLQLDDAWEEIAHDNT